MLALRSKPGIRIALVSCAAGRIPASRLNPMAVLHYK
jgi:hypothetical protein